MVIELILGGARSGKSRYTQQRAILLASDKDCQVVYVATAQKTDSEMASRIERHQQDRPATWQVEEVPLALGEWFQQAEQLPEQVILVDCLTLWLNNQLYHFPKQNFEALFEQLIKQLVASKHHILLVANEVGLGVIPIGEVSRRFVDLAGWLNQAMATSADSVTFIVAGLPMPLKESL